MFIDDIDLVAWAIQKYGYLSPLADLGGQAQPVLADYARGQATGRYQDCFVGLKGRPFDGIDPDYLILNPEQGDAPIEALAQENAFGTVACISVLEHCEDPFAVYRGFKRVLKPNGLGIVTTVFAYRYHPAPVDYWRFSPPCLKMLAERAGLIPLEEDFYLHVLPMAIGDGPEWEVMGVYGIFRKGD